MLFCVQKSVLGFCCILDKEIKASIQYMVSNVSTLQDQSTVFQNIANLPWYVYAEGGAALFSAL